MAYGVCTRCRRLYILTGAAGYCRDCGGCVAPLSDQEARWRLKGEKGGAALSDGRHPKKEA